MRNDAMKEAANITADMMVLAASNAKEHSVSRRDRPTYIALFVSALCNNYSVLTQKEAMQEIADAVREMASAINYVEERELAQ